MLEKLLFLFLGILAFHCAFQACEGARILISAPYGTKSYHNVVVPLALRLVKRNHEVTVITNYKSDELEAVPGLSQIVLNDLEIDMSEYPNPFEAMFSLRIKLISMALGFKNIFLFPRMVAEKFYANSQVQDLIKGVEDNEPFDVVIATQTFNGASYPLAWHFKAPLIIVSPNILFPGLALTLGDSDHPEYLPMFLSGFTDRMNLIERTINTVSTAIYDLFVHRWFWKTIHSIAREHVRDDLPPIGELEKNVSLILTNTHPSINYPRVLLPQVVEVGCINCRQPKPLTSELEQFVSGGKGFVIFAVGSTLPMSDMPDSTIEIFNGAFSRVDVQVIWQWKGEVKHELSGNVLAVPWLPQQDLLGHEHCRGIITHGGLNTLQEAVYHGVPIIGLPFGTDQRLNMNRVARDGYGIKMDWSQLNIGTLTEAINTLLNDPSYATRAKQKSRLFRDQMQSPLERAVFSVEHVIRHNGTEHLRLGSADLASYQRALIDVYLVILLSAAIPFTIFLFCVRKCLKKPHQKGLNDHSSKKTKKQKTK